MSSQSLPFFSIIIPLYNKENFIADTLKSVLAQNFKDFEIIIIDDGSTDDSIEKVKIFEDYRIIIYQQENRGASAARNKGIFLAKGKYITFLDADDYWYPYFLETFYNLVQRYPKNAVYSAAIEIEIGNKTIAALYSVSNQVEENIYLENYFEGSKKQSLIWTSCAVFEKNIFDKTGLFDEQIKSGQDTDLWIRIGNKYKIVFLHKILARYVIDVNSLSRKSALKATIKLKYEKFEEAERENKSLKVFLDYNRYSEAINNKLSGNIANYRYLKRQIDLKNLPMKKIVLLYMPRVFLLIFYKFQKFFIALGWRKTFFK